MRKDKEQAVALRRQGKSYKYIEGKLGIRRSTLHEWFKDELWSKKIKEELQKKNLEKSRINMKKVGLRRGREFQRQYILVRQKAKIEYKRLKKQPLFTAGLCLYWGEGSKRTNSKISITNTDPNLLKIFLSFLSVYLPESYRKVKIHLLIYPDLNQNKCISYWSREVGIQKDRFIKCTRIKGKFTTRPLPFGVAILYVCSRSEKEKLTEWLEAIGKDRGFYTKPRNH